jgi:hypothetical protein
MMEKKSLISAWGHILYSQPTQRQQEQIAEARIESDSRKVNLKATVARDYQNHEIIGASEIFIAGKGWIDIIAGSEEDAMDFVAAGHCPQGKITHINLTLKSEYGSIVHPDFKLA